MRPALYVLFGWLWTVASAISFGAILFDRLGARATWPMAFVVGASMLSLIVTGLALGGALYKGVVLAVGIGAISFCLWSKSHQSLSRMVIPSRWFWLGFAPFAALYFFNAMAPEVSPDGMAYHLGLVSRYWREHRMTPAPWTMYASLSQGIEMLFAFAFGFGRHSAAALVHFTYLIALPLLMVDYAARRGWPLAGMVAALLIFTSPVVGIDGSSAYVDVAVATIWFALFVLLEDFEPRMAIPVGILAGFAYGVKYTAGLALVYALIRLRKDWRSAAIAAGVAALFILPWLVRNWVWLDNPVAPFGNAWFPNPNVTPAFEKEYSEYLRHYNVESWSEWAAAITFGGPKLAGAVGVVALLLPLGAAEWTWIFPALVYPLNIGTRFLIPVLPFLALGAAKILARWRWIAVPATAAIAIVNWPSFAVPFYRPSTWMLSSIPWKAALRITPEEEFLMHKPEYLAARMIEDFVPAGERVFSWSGPAESYTSRDVMISFQSAWGLRIADVFAAPTTASLQPRWSHVLRLKEPQQRIRIVQTQENPAEVWSISEIEPRPLQMRASHFPFQTQLAFDGNPLTRWSSGSALRPGMWVELEFPQKVSEVKMTLTLDQPHTQMKVDLPGAAIQASVGEPAGDLRPLAAETVKQLGIRYFLAEDAGYGGWNVEQLAERGRVKLYRLK